MLTNIFALCRVERRGFSASFDLQKIRLDIPHFYLAKFKLFKDFARHEIFCYPAAV
jgi:hypothetical protein